jgi:hypothetical protein
MDTDNANDYVSLRDAKAGDVIQGDAGKSRLSYAFATSAYSTFSEKVSNINKTDPYVWRYGENDDEKDMGTNYYLQYNINGGEPLDLVEMVGSTYSANRPMVDVYATLVDSFYLYRIKPLLYAQYPLNGITFTHRTPTVLGVPPARAVPILSRYLTEVEYGIFNNFVRQMFPYRYDLERAYYLDFINLREQVVNKFLNTDKYQNFSYLMEASFPQIAQGHYVIELRYILPDGTKGSACKFTYYNPLR